MAGRVLTLLCMLASVTAFTTSRSSLAAPVRRVASTPSVDMKFRVCDLTGKRRNAKAMTVTFSHTRNHKVRLHATGRGARGAVA